MNHVRFALSFRVSLTFKIRETCFFLKILSALTVVLSELVTLEVLQPTPLKRISPRDSKQEPEGENTITFRRPGITRLRIRNHTGI